MRILIVEDQENIARLIKKGLEAESFAVDYILNGEDAMRRIEMYHPDYDLIVLDIMLPGMNGLEICKAMRAKKICTPVILLTAKDGANDIVSGLDVGADDYMVKPFSFEVLLARIRALLRRPKDVLPTELIAQDIILNPATKKVYRKKKELQLTLKEYSLLEYLMRHKGQVVSREQILSNVWDFAYDSFANVVDVHLTNLRKKLGDKGGQVIETVRGIGYRMNE